jgi:hypothetical protein
LSTSGNGPTLVVLAAGRGARFGALKQVDPVGPHGETLLEYSVYDAWRAGFGKLVFVIREEMAASFRDAVGARFERHLPVEYVFQELDRLPLGFVVPRGRTKPWGTAHALLMAADVICEPFAVINADDFYGAEGYGLLACYLQDEDSAGSQAMVGFVLSNTLSAHGAVARGVCRVGGHDWLEEVVELTGIVRTEAGVRNVSKDGRVIDLSGEETVSMNMWGFTPSVFAPVGEYFRRFLEREGAELQSECYLPSAVNELVSAGMAKVKVLRTRDRWFGMTYRDDQPLVVEAIRRLIEEGSYPERLWS